MSSSQSALSSIIRKIHTERDFDALMPAISDDVLSLLQADRFTVYHRSRNHPLTSRFKVGDIPQKIRLKLSAASIAGYVGLSQKILNIKDVYDETELKSIHPELSFNSRYDQQSGYRTRSMLVVPVRTAKVLLGVLQVLNSHNPDGFDRQAVQNAITLASLLGQKFQLEFNSTKGPYDHLVNRGVIKPEALQVLLNRAKAEHKDVAALLQEDRIQLKDIGESLEFYFQVPFQAYDADTRPDRSLLANLKTGYLRQNHWLPVRREGEVVTVMMDDPSDTRRIMEIQKLVHAGDYEFWVSTRTEINRYLDDLDGIRAGESRPGVGDLVSRLEEENALSDLGNEVDEEVEDDAPTIIQLVNQVIRDAYREGASDIHVEPVVGRDDSTVRTRVDGVCHVALTFPRTYHNAVVSRIKIMSNMDIAERRKPQDGKCVVRHQGKKIELRVATLPTTAGESVVMRILASSKPLPINKLSLSARNEAVIRKLVEQPHGIFLVVGPTGSGKTTTLHAILSHINKPERKIWTAEDPVEITQEGLQQVQINHKVGLDFATALRSFLRADPDVIMIGEMRDQETAHSGIEASLTGHLVFSTLHTNSAVETIVRLLDLGLDPVNFSDALLGVLAQRLVRTLCPACKQACKATPEEVTMLRHFYGESHAAELDLVAGSSVLYRAKGCDACQQSGYRGRVGIHELLYASTAMKDAIYHRQSVEKMAGIAVQDGTRTLIQDGIQKVLAGMTDITQVRKVAASSESGLVD